MTIVAVFVFTLILCIFVYIAGVALLSKRNNTSKNQETRETSKNNYVWQEGAYNIVRCADCCIETSIGQAYNIRESLHLKHWTVRNGRPYCNFCSEKYRRQRATIGPVDLNDINPPEEIKEKQTEEFV